MRISEIINEDSVAGKAKEIHGIPPTMLHVSRDKIIDMFGPESLRDMENDRGTMMFFDRDKSGRSWKVLKTPGGNIYIERDHMLEGDSIMFECTDKALAGVIVELSEDRMVIEGGMFPMIGPEEAPGEMETGDKRSFTVRMEFEDGGKVTRVFLAKDKEEALQKAMKWAKNEYDPEQGVEARILSEAEYHGRKVKLGKPMAGDVKKYKVYVRDPKTGNIKKVNFGDKGMEIRRDDPKRRKSFRARHGCGTPRASDRMKAAYWSCRLWSTKKVGDILKGK